MKKSLLVFLFLFISTKLYFAQGNWIPQTSGTTADLYSVFFINDLTGWAVGNLGKILKTTNGGANWSIQTVNTSHELYSVFFIDENNGWVVGSGVILKTTSGGNQWITQEVNTTLYSTYFISTTTGFAASIDGYILKTTDSGNNWVQKNVHWICQLNTVFFISPSTGFVGGTYGEIWKTTDAGESWNILISGIDGGNVKSIYFTSANDGFAAGSSAINKTTNGGNSWSNYYWNNYDYYYSIKFINPTTGWVCGYASKIRKTTDGGTTWVDEGVSSATYLWGIYFPSENYGWCVGGNGTILKYTTPSSVSLLTPNGGENWQVGSVHNITWTSVSVTNVKLEYTTNNGTSWAQIVASTAASTGSYGWTVPNTPSTQCKVRLSDATNALLNDESNSVFAIENPVPIQLINFSAVVNIDQVKLCWKTATETDNYGFEVERASNDNQFKKIGFVSSAGNSNSPKEYSFTDNNLVGGSSFRYRLKQIDAVGTYEYSNVIEVEIELPIKYDIRQNYPNPFNPVTTIIYSVPEDQKISLRVYDVLGGEVATLVNGEQATGYYEVNFDASKLASGIYYYKLQAGSFIDTKKMILLK